VREAQQGLSTIETSGAGLNTSYDIIVLGAGFTGAALTAHLSQQVIPGTRILLAGDEAEVGLAYVSA
jgi:cation diffusion facilitator CzcD-associated flavoprotein CzcO